MDITGDSLLGNLIIELFTGHSRNTDIDDHLSLADMIALDKMRLPRSNHQDISGACDFGEVRRLAMRNGYGRIGIYERLRRRLAHKRRTPHDDDMLPRHGNLVLGKKR